MVEYLTVDLSARGYEKVNVFPVVAQGTALASHLEHKHTDLNLYFTPSVLRGLAVKHFILLNEFFNRGEYLDQKVIMDSLSVSRLNGSNEPYFGKIENNKRQFSIFYMLRENRSPEIGVINKIKQVIDVGPVLVNFDIVSSPDTVVEAIRPRRLDGILPGRVIDMYRKT